MAVTLRKKKDLILAYVLLAHAAIESFCEEIALEAVSHAEKKSNAGQGERLISRLIFVYAKKNQENLEPFSHASMVRACEKYRNEIGRNHRVKASNILKIFLPLGLSHADFDDLFLNNLNSFGRQRGRFAHQTARINQPSIRKTKNSWLIVF